MSMWYPITPGGSVLADLAADTEQQAWANLMADMEEKFGVGGVYESVDAAKERGYEVVKRSPT